MQLIEREREKARTLGLTAFVSTAGREAKGH